MKRLFALILAVTMMLALTACGNSAPAEPPRRKMEAKHQTAQMYSQSRLILLMM